MRAAGLLTDSTAGGPALLGPSTAAAGGGGGGSAPVSAALQAAMAQHSQSRQKSLLEQHAERQAAGGKAGSKSEKKSKGEEKSEKKSKGEEKSEKKEKDKGAKRPAGEGYWWGKRWGVGTCRGRRMGSPAGGQARGWPLPPGFLSTSMKACVGHSPAFGMVVGVAWYGQPWCVQVQCGVVVPTASTVWTID